MSNRLNLSPAEVMPGTPTEVPFDVPPAPAEAPRRYSETTQKDVVEMPILPQEREAFAAHVEDVRKHGDALNVPLYRRKVLGLGLIGGTVFPAIPETVANVVDIAAITSSLTTGVLTTGVAWGLYRFRHMPRSDRLLATPTQDLLGERYNLYVTPRSKFSSEPPRVGMRYYGPVEPKEDATVAEKSAGVLAHIQKMARIAREQGISEIAVGAEWVKGLGLTADATNVEAFLKPYGLQLEVDNARELISMSPTKWLDPPRPEIKNGAENRQMQPLERLNKLVTTLASVRPGHPLVSTYNRHAPDKLPESDFIQKAIMDKLKIELGATLPAAIERLSDLTYYRPGQREQVIHDQAPDRRSVYQRAELPPKDFDSRRTFDASSAFALTPEPTSVVWLDKEGSIAETGSVRSALGLSARQMDRLLAAPTRNPDALAKLVTLLIVDEVRRGEPSVKLDFFEDKNKTVEAGLEPITDIPTQYLGKDEIIGMQEMVLPKTKAQPGWGGTERRKVVLRRVTNDPFCWRLVRGVIATAVVGGVLAGASLEADNAYDNATDAAAQELADAQGLEPSDIPKDDAQHLAEANSFTMQAIGTGLRFEQQVHKTFNFTFGPGGNGAPSDPGAASEMGKSQVGNASSNGPARTDWQLKAEGGLDTAGYWTFGTSSVLEHTQNGIDWERSTFTGEPMAVPLHPRQQAPSITVSRDLTSSEYVVYGDDLHISVPELDDTSIVAADFNGSPVSLISNSDGTDFLDISEKLVKSGPKKLEYVLQKSPYAIPAHATKPITEESNKISDTLYKDLIHIHHAWDRVVPNFSNLSTYDKAQAIAAYIRQNFDYRVDPFDKGSTIDGTLPSNFVDNVLELKKANCNVAATMVALGVMNSDEFTQPNIAFGYMNDKGGAVSSLNTHQLHEWVVFPNGQRLDATPSKGITAADEAYLHPHKVTPHPEQAPVDPLEVGLGLSAFVAAVAQRRRIAQGARWAGQGVQQIAQNQNDKILDRAHDAFSRTDEHDIYVATEVANAWRYDPDQDIAAAIDRGQNRPASGYDPTSTTEENQAKNPFNILTAAHMQGAHVEAVLRQGIAQATDPGQRAVLEQGLAIIQEAWNLQFAGNSAVKYLFTQVPGYRNYQQKRSK